MSVVAPGTPNEAWYLIQWFVKQWHILRYTHQVQDWRERGSFKRSKDVVHVMEKDKKNTYTFLVLKSLETEDGVRISERCASKAALQEH